MGKGQGGENGRERERARERERERGRETRKGKGKGKQEGADKVNPGISPICVKIHQKISFLCKHSPKGPFLCKYSERVSNSGSTPSRVP